MAIEVRLYGKLRRLAPRYSAATDDCVLRLPIRQGGVIEDVLARLGIACRETSNIFLNGELSELTQEVCDGDRIGIFPDDMALLYRWYFSKKGPGNPPR